MRVTHHLASSVVAGADQIAVAVFGHPAGTGEMSGVDAPGAIGLLDRIEAENDVRRFLPVHALGFCIEQAQIGHEMTAVILGQFVAAGRLVLKTLLRHIDPQ